MKSEPKAHVVTLPDENVNAVLLYNKRARIPKAAHAHLLQRGIVPIEVEDTADVRVIPVPIVHRVESNKMDLVSLAALKTVAGWTGSGPPADFGTKLAKLLIEAADKAKGEHASGAVAEPEGRSA